MRIEGDQRIKFGPGGEIRNVPENQGLLEALAKAPVLQPTVLLKLASFYKGYPTNVPLGNHLGLLALAMRSGEETLQEVFPEFDPVDVGEDWFDHTDEGSEPVNNSSDSIQLFVREVPLMGLGLLIETLIKIEENKEDVRHFFIGVSPLV